MDHMEFALEQLRRSLLRWAEDVKHAQEAMSKMDDETKVIPYAIVLHNFPIEEFTEFRDLVVARAETLIERKEE